MSLFTQDAALKQHSAYRMAKAGDQNAALDLVIDLAVSWLYGERTRFEPGLFFVAPHEKCVRLIKERFDDKFTQVFGVEHAAFTANEAQDIAGFRSTDTLRNRRAAAEQEIDRRLRSKGIARTSQAASAGLRSEQDLNDSNLGTLKKVQ
ncbi:hypothetical protein H663_009045 [Limnohabitans planktonicus II-D5]|uniref:Uncharacterized protein n=2 Tax=Limnohabitans planktonicus TaxID=540060 RepID=A0A2T7UEL7_9BURK|nr:hypothetical protein H663_009045 [Limnohabitans planktonicus II-D5]|eukprot:gene14893-17087_t